MILSTRPCFRLWVKMSAVAASTWGSYPDRPSQLIAARNAGRYATGGTCRGAGMVIGHLPGVRVQVVMVDAAESRRGIPAAAPQLQHER